jgi:hypothetical protein
LSPKLSRLTPETLQRAASDVTQLIDTTGAVNLTNYVHRRTSSVTEIGTSSANKH